MPVCSVIFLPLVAELRQHGGYTLSQQYIALPDSLAPDVRFRSWGSWVRKTVSSSVAVGVVARGGQPRPRQARRAERAEPKA